jgi:hypothetical protein
MEYGCSSASSGFKYCLMSTGLYLSLTVRDTSPNRCLCSLFVLLDLKLFVKCFVYYCLTYCPFPLVIVSTGSSERCKIHIGNDVYVDGNTLLVSNIV